MELTLKKNVCLKDHIIFHALLGSLFIALCALVKFPTLPVPTTLQTFAIFVLALVQGPKRAFLSGIFYLAEATLGLPVLCGSINPLWFIGPHGGYLVAFPLAAFLIGALAQNHTSRVHQLGAIFMGQLVIYSLGFLWLQHFIGVRGAFVYGVLFFIPTAILKAVIAVECASFVRKRKEI